MHKTIKAILKFYFYENCYFIRKKVYVLKVYNENENLFNQKFINVYILYTITVVVNTKHTEYHVKQGMSYLTKTAFD